MVHLQFCLPVILIRMLTARLAITSEPLAIEVLAADLEREAQAQGEGCGAVCTFAGHRARDPSGPARAVPGLRGVHAAGAEERSSAFARRSRASGRTRLVAIHHRVGRLRVGEASVAIAAASAHRAQAFQVCRYAIERVKQIAPIWKHEYFEDGDAWVEGATADVDDDEARRRARETACA